MSVGEPVMRPTAMMYRNLAAMTIEEMLRANPVDGAVLLGGCDKTVPALLMAAASVDLPAILLSGGPAITGRYHGERVGCGTDIWRMSEERRAGRVTGAFYEGAMGAMLSSRGHCNTMGTASTMACMTEALGMSLPGAAGVPAVQVQLLRNAHEAGSTAVRLVNDDLRPSQIMTRGAFLNAAKALAAIGGSTNAIIHLLAIAGRLAVDFVLDDFDTAAADIPLLVNVTPAGKYLMDDLYRAGGFRAVLSQIADVIDTSAITVTGKPIGDGLGEAEVWDADVIYPRAAPLQAGPGIAVVYGNLAPTGAVIKPSAASPELLVHRGRAVVFESLEDAIQRIDSPALDVDETCVLVLRGCGPKGYPGMPEVGNVPLPRKLLEQGVRDMVRVSDARMSGTAYGTVVLHTTPESAVGGPLGVVENGDYIVLNVEKRELRLEIPDDELRLRLSRRKGAEPSASRGWEQIYLDHVLQADTGMDLDFLRGASGSGEKRTGRYKR